MLLSGHKYSVNSCQFSPGSTLLCSSSTDGTSIIWDVRTAEVVTTLIQPSAAAVRVSVFCPDSSLLATAGDDEEVCLWDISTGELVRRIREHEATVFSISFSPDGAVLVSTDVLGRCKVWASMAGHAPQLTAVEEAHDLGVTCVAFSPEHEKTALTTTFSLFTCGNDGEVAAWGLSVGPENKMFLHQKVFGHEGAAMAVTVSPDGELVASSGGDKLVKLWSACLDCLQVLQGHTRYVSTVAFSHNGRYLASGSNDRTVRVWLLSESEGTSNSPELGEESLLYTSNRSETFYQVQLAKTQQRQWQTLTGHQQDVNSCDMVGDLLATGSNDCTIRLWRYQTGDPEQYVECEVSPLLGHNYSVYSLRFSPDGASLVSGSLDGRLIVWDVATAGILHTYKHSSAFRSVVFSGDNVLVAGGCDDDNVHVWNILDNTTTVLQNHENTVFAVSFSPDCCLLASGCSGGSLVLWSLDSRRPLEMASDAHDLGVTGCVFKTDSELYTVGQDANIKIWTFKSEERELSCVQTIRAHSTSIMSLWLSSSQDVEIFVTTSGDKTGKVWSCQTLRCLATLGPCASYVTSGALNYQRNLFALCVDRSCVLYRVELGPIKLSKSAARGLPAELQSAGAAPSAEQQVGVWSAEDVRQWLAALGLTTNTRHIDGAGLVQASLQDLRDLGLTEAEAKKVVEELKLVSDNHNDIPNEFLCPITCDIMSDPVKCSDGFIYEKTAIKEWLMTRRNTSPMTNLEMTDSSLIHCDELKQRIDTYLAMR